MTDNLTMGDTGKVRATASPQPCHSASPSPAVSALRASVRRIGADTVPVAITLLIFVAVGLFGGL